MATSARPRQKFRQKAISVPITQPLRDEYALRVHLLIEALAIEPSDGVAAVFSYYLSLLETCAAAKAAPSHLMTYCRAATGVVVAMADRADATGSWTATDDEQRVLRGCATGLDVLFAQFPVTLLYQAEQKLSLLLCAA